MSKEEAKQKAIEGFNEYCEIMSSEQMAARRNKLYIEMCEANKYGIGLKFTEAQLRRIANNANVSSLPEHILERAKSINSGKPIEIKWW